MSVKVGLCIIYLEGKKQCPVLVQSFCSQMCKTTVQSRQWIVGVLFAHMQTQRKQMCRLDATGVHAVLVSGCLAMAVYKETCSEE